MERGEKGQMRRVDRLVKTWFVLILETWGLFQAVYKMPWLE